MQPTCHRLIRLLTAVAFGFPLLAFSQAPWRLSQLDFSGALGGGIGAFRSNDLIFPHRHQQGTFTGLVQLHGMAGFSTGDRHTLWAGLGYRRDGFAMNRTNFSEAVFSIVLLPWSNFVPYDTIPLDRVSVSAHSISLPLGYSYRLTKRANAGVQMETRLLVIPGVKLSANAQLTEASFVSGPGGPPPPLTPDQIDRLKAAYRNGTNTFSLMVAPEINMLIRLSKHESALHLGCMPLAMDLAQPLNSYVNSPIYMRFTLGYRANLR